MVITDNLIDDSTIKIWKCFFIKSFLTSIVLCIFCAGCSTKIITVQDVNSSTNSQNKALGAFNDERYVWEGWTFSTNNVNKLK